MKRVLLLYKNAYGGLSNAAWLLALIMFINRAGSMVIPFLSIYLITQLKLSVAEVGIVLSAFGLGSMAGSFLGGYLTDRIGQFKVQFMSLTVGGLMFLVLAYVKTYEYLVVWLFLVSTVADSLRPANASSVALYARPENVTRAFSLNRMAVNLGFSIGPAIGGLLAAMSYFWLFMVDGFTCIAAGFLFYFAFRNRKTYQPENSKTSETGEKIKRVSAFKDKRYLAFAFCCCIFATLFFQLFTTLPLYYREIYQLPEENIGLLLGLNGLVVFVFEMVLVYLYGNKFKTHQFIVTGILLTGLSFVLLNLFEGAWILYLAMIVLSFSEIFAMPFMVTYTVERSGAHNKGSYMGLYALSYSTAFVIAPFLGTQIIMHYGFDYLWWFAGVLAIIGALGFYLALNVKKV
ncbi:MAG: MFS transporter [Bacteroidetes bacterium]|nr:MFS transporter [Bacteroidota bacterium]